MNFANPIGIDPAWAALEIRSCLNTINIKHNYRKFNPIGHSFCKLYHTRSRARKTSKSSE